MKFALLAAPALFGFLAGQMPSKPPMKMGLWETTTNSSISMPGMNMPSGVGNRTTTVRSCATPESYADAFRREELRASCERSNEKWTGSTYSFDIACGQPKGKGHFEMTFDTADAGHGTMHVETAMQDHSMTLDMTMKAHWLSADCGAVAPGKGVIVR